METPFVITLIPKGTPNHPRFVIGNQVQVWTGNQWSLEEDEGLLYGSESDARDACLGMAEFDGKPAYRFTCPLQIEIRSDTPPDIDALKVWLSRNARLYVNDAPNAIGVEHDSLAVVKLDFYHLDKSG